MNFAKRSILTSIWGRIALAASLALVLLSWTEAATITAANASFAAVSTAVGLAANGDTVVVPAGTATWTSTLSITKGITLQGSGIGSTTLQDDTPRPAGQGLIFVSLTSTQRFRLTGFTFAKGTSTVVKNGGIVTIGGASSAVRVDHCYFQSTYSGQSLVISGTTYGVCDHCRFDCKSNIMAEVRNGGSTNKGWEAWADYPYFGTNKFFFFEDNTTYNLSTVLGRALPDASNGGRYVFRHNTVNDANFAWHGTEGAWLLGTRTVEIYGNSMIHTGTNGGMAVYSMGNVRSGTILFHDNTYTGQWASCGAIHLHPFRQFWTAANWHGADGTNPWDLNDPTTYYTGTNVGVTSGSSTPIVSGNIGGKYTGFQVVNTNSASPYFRGHAAIASITYNATTNRSTITLSEVSDRPIYSKFNPGDTLAIHKVLTILDQPGVGKGALLTGTAPTPAWPHQAVEPCYSWNNTANAGFTSGNSSYVVVPNVHYYNLGGGFGSTPPAVSSRYVAALNGVNYTGPYTYPHPLVSGATTAQAPAPPTNLTIVP